MPFRRHRMLLEIAPSGGPSDPGVSGPGAPAGGPSPSIPPPSPEPRVPFSVDDLDGGSAPAGARGGGAAPRQPQDNPIPYTRHAEMIERARAEARAQAAQERDAFYQAQFQQLTQRMQPRQNPLDVVKQALRMAGIEVPEEQPRPVSAEDIESRFAAMEQRFGQAFQLRNEAQTAEAELNRLKAENGDYFDAEGEFENLVTDLWAADENRTVRQSFDLAKKILDAHYDRRTQSYANAKQRDGAHQPLRAAAPAPAGTSRRTHDLATHEGQDSAIDDLLDRELG